LKNAERKITADLKRTLKEEKPLMKTLRETKWFEKFYWFISSEGYLVLGLVLPRQNLIVVPVIFYSLNYSFANISGKTTY